MDGRLASGDVDRVQRAFLFDQAVDDAAEFLTRHHVVVFVLNDADRALEIAVVGDLDNGKTTVLLVVRAEAAIGRAAVLDGHRVLKRD